MVLNNDTFHQKKPHKICYKFLAIANTLYDMKKNLEWKYSANLRIFFISCSKWNILWKCPLIKNTQAYYTVMLIKPKSFQCYAVIKKIFCSTKLVTLLPKVVTYVIFTNVTLAISCNFSSQQWYFLPEETTQELLQISRNCKHTLWHKK